MGGCRERTGGTIAHQSSCNSGRQRNMSTLYEIRRRTAPTPRCNPLEQESAWEPPLEMVSCQAAAAG